MKGQFGYRREQRLGGKEISAILAASRRFKGNCVAVQVRRNTLGVSRLGLIVPKRFIPRSVDRNRIKREIREWFRHRQRDFMGFDILVRIYGPRNPGSLLIDDLDRLPLPVGSRSGKLGLADVRS